MVTQPQADRSGTPGSGEEQSSDGPGFLAGRPFGIPVYVAPSWFLVAALITFVFAAPFQRELPQSSPWVGYLLAFVFAVLLYASVLVHELAHSLVALKFGLPVRRIALYLLGGVSEIDREPATPGQEFLVAAAGPALSLGLGGLGYLGIGLVEDSDVPRVLLTQLTWANLVVGVFNLLPGLPLDGGRVLRAAIWKLTGHSFRATVIAAWVGRACGGAIIVLPLIGRLLGHDPSTPMIVWTLLIGAFIWIGAGQSLRHAKVRERVPALLARTLTRRAVPVEADLPLAEALRRAREAGANGLVVVDRAGVPTAVVCESAVTATPEQRRPWVQVGDLARALEPGMTLGVDLAGDQLINALRAFPATEYLVVESDGSVFGVLAAVDVEHAFGGA